MRAVVLDADGIRFDPNYEPAVTNQRLAAGEMIAVDVRIAGICETDYQLVRGYMGFSGVPGHEFVGTARTGKFEGQRVVGEINCACRACELCVKGLGNHCPYRSVIGILNHDGAFADRLLVPEENLLPVPDSMPDKTAVFTEPLAAAFQIPQQIDINGMESAVVVGAGRLGYLVAQVLSNLGLHVLVIGKHQLNLERVRNRGIETELKSSEGRRTFDLAVDCSGSVTGIPTAMRYLKPRGTLVLKTTVADSSGPDLAPVVIDEITMVGSRCGPFDVALKALERGEIEVESLVSERIGLEEAVDALGRKSTGKVLVDVGS